MDYKAIYDAEIGHRDRLRNGVTVSSAILTAFVGLLGAMVKSYHLSATRLDQVFVFGTTAAGCFAALAIYFLVRSYHGHVYKAMPSALELRAHEADLREWHRETSSNDAAAAIDFESWLQERYAAAADHNFCLNASSGKLLSRANSLIIYCGLALVLAYVPHSFAERQRPDTVYRVAIERCAAGQSLTGGSNVGSTEQAPQAKRPTPQRRP